MDQNAPRRLLLAGDGHANGRWMGSLCKLARRYDCDGIFQLGDFGDWPDTDDGVRFLEQVSLEATELALVVHSHWHHRYSHELTWPDPLTFIDGKKVLPGRGGAV